MGKTKYAALLLMTLILSSCGIFGIHFKVHNPRHAGSYPAFGEETVLLGTLSPLRRSFDVTFYDLDITINAPDKSLEGWVGITGRALSDIDSVQLDLDDPLTIRSLNLGSREGTPLRWNRHQRAVYVQLQARVSKGSLVTLYVQYGGRPVVAKKAPWQGGLVWKKDKQKNDWIGVACETEGASIWFPCKDHTSDEPDSARLRFTIPESELMVVSNGVFEGLEKKEGQQSFRWSVHNPINLYNLSFYVGNFEHIADTCKGVDGRILSLDHYVLKPNAAKARVHFAGVKNHIRVYEKIYGPYAWYEDGFKLVESPYAGMEHQTAIAYGNGYKHDLKKVEDYIMLHETGHEWFGNAVTAADLADVWLQEGITTYGEALYLEQQYGRETAQSHMQFYRWMIANKRPLVGPRDRRFFDYKDGDVYVKGAWMLHSLRHTINNDSLFFSVLRTFYREQQKKVTDSKTFIATTNKVTGSDYNWFFDQYLYRNTVPFLEYEVKDDILYYCWTAANEAFDKMPVTLLVNGKALQVYPAAFVQKLELPSGDGKPVLYIDDSSALFGKRKSGKLHKMVIKKS